MQAAPVKPKVIKPVLKWAGGKRQLIPALSKYIPNDYKQYIEPFFGGGALFFHLQPRKAVIADANAEIINLYRVIANDLTALVDALQHYKNEEAAFYAERARDQHALTDVQAAARTLYLNRTCFNGLYRVNKKGEFNVPFGKYTNPTICDKNALEQAASLFKKAAILDGDYRLVLHKHAKEDDFIFLDPPYVPISQFSDFKRYTKEQFGEKDHVQLANEVAKLQDSGCHVVLTNSNSELVHELYKKFSINVVDSKRNINSKGNKRTGKDVIVVAQPKRFYQGELPNLAIPERAEPKQAMLEQATPEQETSELAAPEKAVLEQATPEQDTSQRAASEKAVLEQATPDRAVAPERAVTKKAIPEEATSEQAAQKTPAPHTKPNTAEQIAKFPPTRFMGSKSKILQPVQDAILSQPCDTVLDLFSGSGVVSYMLKASGKTVITNDYMAFSALIGRALIENSTETLPESTAMSLLEPNNSSDNFVEQTFEGLYFTTTENRLIDDIRANIKQLESEYAKAIATSALVRACFKKRPRGIFTYVGQRYDDGRKDLSTSLSTHFLYAVNALNNAVFDNGKINTASRIDALQTQYTPDLVYIDPPYYSQHSDNEYVRRYHFVEGIACDWKGVEMQWDTKTRKFKNYPTPFSTKKGTYEAFDKLFERYKQSTLVVSYSSNSMPTKDEMIALLGKYKSNVDVIAVSHKYSFGNQAHKVEDNNNAVSEYIFIAS